ncbi:MAG: LemA family protein [Candidatus Dojkabacteria bacterium]|uniref:LemA family protein n=2 Tax=Candidatus Dojkabacteria TaxID=74243 RepID=A0A136KG62_9BACT|nr:MAG: LemA family protein [candidate division WS6 bacterium OLB21]MBW7953809.1 LemA family protein [Candidatus Dojkabacteria bacterium]WKZ27658.1 MAG: LemA family protein [Candidatus Dojkabacteria bacterium]
MPILILFCFAAPITLVVGALVFAVGLYNGLVRAKVIVDEAWSGIDVQLKRRYDLIPNIVETIKGYAKHEKETFEKVTMLRSQAMQTSDVAEKGKLENQLTQTLKSLFAVAENYPELKANENFLNLQGTLNEIENEIQGARRYYNGAVRDYNTKIMVFPNNLIAGLLGFKSREFFEADEAEKENVKVSFSEEEKA